MIWVFAVLINHMAYGRFLEHMWNQLCILRGQTRSLTVRLQFCSTKSLCKWTAKEMIIMHMRSVARAFKFSKCVAHITAFELVPYLP